jgi:hypothetical protein
MVPITLTRWCKGFIFRTENETVENKAGNNKRSKLAGLQ